MACRPWHIGGGQGGCGVEGVLVGGVGVVGVDGEGGWFAGCVGVGDGEVQWLVGEGDGVVEGSTCPGGGDGLKIEIKMEFLKI